MVVNRNFVVCCQPERCGADSMSNQGLDVFCSVLASVGLISGSEAQMMLELFFFPVLKHGELYQWICNNFGWESPLTY